MKAKIEYEFNLDESREEFKKYANIETILGVIYDVKDFHYQLMRSVNGKHNKLFNEDKEYSRETYEVLELLCDKLNKCLQPVYGIIE